MNLELNEFLNTYDISFVIICLISIFFGIKNGLIKSIFNLLKWIIIFVLIKNSFDILRPIADPYITNQTISDILIFLFTIVTSYIFLSFTNRLIIGIIQPKKSGFLDFSFGAILGVIRGYIVFVLLIFFINNNFSASALPRFLDEGSFKDIVIYGLDFIDVIPRNIGELNN